jgi:hypothetical protein
MPAVGDRVRVDPFRTMAGFDGVIEERVNWRVFNVRDSRGRLWCRTRDVTYVLPASTRDLLDWLDVHHPERLKAVAEARGDEERASMRRYLIERRKERKMTARQGKESAL